MRRDRRGRGRGGQGRGPAGAAGGAARGHQRGARQGDHPQVQPRRHPRRRSRRRRAEDRQGGEGCLMSTLSFMALLHSPLIVLGGGLLALLLLRQRRWLTHLVTIVALLLTPIAYVEVLVRAGPDPGGGGFGMLILLF